MKEFDEKFEDYNEPGGLEIDIAALWNKLIRQWKRVLIWVVSFAVVGVVIGMSIPKTYLVSAKLAPELTNSTVNRLSSLASLAGMNANMLGSTDAVYPMVYPDIVHSTPFLVDLFDMPVDIVEDGEAIHTTLYDYLLNHTKSPWWGSILSLPGRSIGWVKGLFVHKEETVACDSTVVDPFHLNVEQYAVARGIGGCIGANVDKKTLVISIDVMAQDPVVAANLAKNVIENLKRYVTDYRTGKAKNDVEYYSTLLEEAKADYHAAQRRYASYVDSHQSLVFQSTRVEQDRLQNDMNLKYQLYNSIAQQLQQANAKVQQETPVFAEIIPPSVPLRAAKPSKKKILLLFMVLGAMAGAADALRKSIG